MWFATPCVEKTRVVDIFDELLLRKLMLCTDIVKENIIGLSCFLRFVWHFVVNNLNKILQQLVLIKVQLCEKCPPLLSNLATGLLSFHMHAVSHSPSMLQKLLKIYIHVSPLF